MNLPAGLALAYPMAGWLLPPVLGGLLALYTVRSQPKQKLLPSLRLWKEVLARKRPNTLLSRFQHSLFLLLQALVLAALVAGLTRPEIRSDTAGDVLIAVDVGASMGARDGRFDDALEVVRGLLERRRDSDRAELVAAGETSAPLGPLTRDPGELQAELAKLVPREGPGPRAEDLLVLLQHLRTRDTASIHIISDSLTRDDLASGIPGARVVLHHVGNAKDNLGITRLDVRPDGPAWQVNVLVRNFSGTPAEVEVELLTAPPVPSQKELVEPLGRERLFVFRKVDPAAGVFAAKLTVRRGPPDLLAVDDKAWSAPRRGAARVLVIGASGSELARALELNPAVETVATEPSGFAALKPQLDGFDLVVSQGFWDKALEGRGLLFFQGDGVSPFSTGSAMPAVELTRQDGTHPVTRYLDVGQVSFTRAYQLDKLARGRPVLQTDLGPLIATVEDGRARQVVCAFPLTGTDFPQHVAFPIFLTNVVRWILANDSRLQGHFRVGQPIRIRGGKPIEITDPGGAVQALPATTEAMVVAAPFTRTGIWKVQRKPDPALAYPVDLLDPTESDIRPAGEGQEEIGAADPAAPGGEGEHGLWRILLHCALAFLCLEWGLLSVRGGRTVSLVLGHPESAWLGLALVLLAALWARSRIYIAPRARMVLLGLRALSVSLVVAALLDPRLTREERGRGRGAAVLLDASDSIGADRTRELAGAALARWRVWTQALGPAADLSLGFFGEAVREVPREALAAGDLAAVEAALEAARSGTGKQGTDLAEALSHVREGLPAQDALQVFLCTDGRPTRGDLDAELTACKLRGLRIFPLPTSTAKADPLYLEELQAPLQVFAGDEYAVSVRIASDNPGSVRLLLRQNGTLIERTVVPVKPGITVWTRRLKADAPGGSALEAQIEPVDLPDLHPENDVYSAYTRHRQVPRLLVVSASAEAAAPLMEGLKATNMIAQVQTWRELPDADAALAPYSALVLDSPGGQDVTPSQQEAIRRFVEKHGGGLLMLASKDSASQGTWLRDTLERALPVYLTPRAEESPFALYLLLDSSGSMAGAPIAQVKFAAKRLMSMMSGRYLGVIHFDIAPHVAIPLQRVGSNRIMIETDIDAIQAMGGTAYTPSLQIAYRELKALGTTQNHVLLLSDGQPADQHLVPNYYQPFKDAGIEISTVGIGEHIDEEILRRIAENCGGRYYPVTDLTQVVAIFEKEVERLIGPPWEDRTLVPVANPKHFLAKGLAGKTLPPLYGYLGTTLKPGADAAVVTDTGDPLLATWQYGLGRAAVWNAGLRGPWMKDWRAWKDGFAPFWESVIKAIVRSELSEFKLSLALEGKRCSVTVDAVDREGRFLDGEKLELRVKPPGDLPVLKLPVQQVEAGRYETSFPVSARGFHAATLARVAAGNDEVLNEGGIALGFDPEYRPAPPDVGLLQRLASTTGGAMLRDLDDIAPLLLEETTRTRPISNPVWPWLAGLAVLVFFAEVALRRLTRMFVSDTGELDGEGGGAQATYLRIAENYQRMADDLDARGDPVQAQAHYLKARSFFLKANQEGVASRMWEKYRKLERRGT